MSEQGEGLERLLFTFLWSALASHKRGSLVHRTDCPDSFIDESTQEVNVEAMLQEVRGFPSLESKRQNLLPGELLSHSIPQLTPLTAKQVDLLSWLTVCPDESRLQPCSFEEFAREYPSQSLILSQSHSRPSLILRIVHQRADLRKEKLFSRFGALLGFHGTGVENLHSILRHGFQEKYIKVDQGLFGDGIYLSTDPSVARGFIQYWPVPEALKDKLGHQYVLKYLGERLGGVMVSEVAKDPSLVRFAADNRSSSYLGLSGEGSIAKHYVLASSNQVIRHKFLFLYAQAPSPRSRLPWLVLAYILLLCLIVGAKSKTLKRTFAWIID